MTDNATHKDLPPAFTEPVEPDGAPEDQFGAGHLIDPESDSRPGHEHRREADDLPDDAKVEEGSEESFPGSDPPAYGNKSRT